MRYDPADRILSLSFSRDPEEHASAMIEAGRKLAAPTGRVSPWGPFFLMIGIGVAIGVVMESYRAYVLPSLLGTTEIAPLPVILLELLPVVLIGAALVSIYAVRAGARQRRSLVSRFDPHVVIDVDIFRQGIGIASGAMTMDIDWTGIRDVITANGRIDFEAEGYMIYIPERAFANHAAYTEGSREIRKLWREAVRHDRDSRMIEAGLD